MFISSFQARWLASFIFIFFFFDSARAQPGPPCSSQLHMGPSIESTKESLVAFLIDSNANVLNARRRYTQIEFLRARRRRLRIEHPGIQFLFFNFTTELKSISESEINYKLPFEGTGINADALMTFRDAVEKAFPSATFAITLEIITDGQSGNTEWLTAMSKLGANSQTNLILLSDPLATIKVDPLTVWGDKSHLKLGKIDFGQDLSEALNLPIAL